MADTGARLRALVVMAGVLGTLGSGTSASASPRAAASPPAGVSPRAAGSLPTAPPLPRVASSARARAAAADQALVAAARAAGACHDAGGGCAASDRALTRAGRRAFAVRDAVPGAGARPAPTLRATAGGLGWSAVRGAPRFVVRVSGRGGPADVLLGGATGVALGVPAARTTTTYRVRAAVAGGPWSAAIVVTPPGPMAGTPSAAAGPDPAAAALPTPSPGLAAATPASSASPDPPAAPGPPAAPDPPAAPGPPAPPAAPPPPAGALRIGVVVGSAVTYTLPSVQALGARSARIEVAIDTPVEQVVPLVRAYARAGIRAQLLAGFPGRIPTVQDARTLGSWAAAFGPHGWLWAAEDLPASLAVDRIEFGNESSGPWQYPELAEEEDWAHDPRYAAIAEGYGRAFVQAADAVAAADPGVRLLAVADVAGRWPQWMDGLFRGAPDLAAHVGGWTVHPYGPDWARGVDDALDQARAHGASDDIGLYATETGLATDDGRCLGDNYGWDPCLTYAQAADALTSTVDALQARYPTRLREVDVYAARDLADPGRSTEREDFFGALTATGTAKGAFTRAVQRLLARGA